MSDGSRIEWTDATWNPVAGCSPVSAGCANCYARRMAGRLRAMGVPKYADGFRPAYHPASLEEPDRWRRPRRVFVCSMGDLFHHDIPLSFLREVFDTMARSERHVFQVLTKRPTRVADLADEFLWTPNIWLGVSVEDNAHVWRVNLLDAIPASVRFVSLEPLLGPVPRLLDLDAYCGGPLACVDWLILGGETGPGARPMPEGWPAILRDVCIEREIPFFFKKWGDAYATRGRVLEGRMWDESPSWTGEGRTV